MRLTLALAIPIALIVVGLLLLIGCVTVPATGQLQPNFVPRPEFSIGTGHDKPVQLGVTRIDDAFITLSRQVQVTTYDGWIALPRTAAHNRWMILNNWSVSPDARQFAVGYTIRKSTTFNCFPIAVPDTEQRYAVLDVNADGIVTGAKTTTTRPFSAVFPDRWLRVFDPDMRRKLQEAEVFPTDEEIEKARRVLGARFGTTQPDAPSTNTTENGQ